MGSRLIIIQAAGLGYDLLHKHTGGSWNGLNFQPLTSVFPAVTCTAQASFRTALPPSRHGMIANGLFHRDLRRPLLWEQSSALVSGPRIWDSYRSRGKRVALLFWQQSLGENVDIILSPAPIHKHGGGMIQSVYSQPHGLYESLCRKVGRKFQLHRYWGPIASTASSDWIARATATLLSDPDMAPDLCLTYLPALDYDLQRHGPEHPAAKRALDELLDQIALIRKAGTENGYDLLVFGDYAIGSVSQAIFPNRALHAAGHFKTRTIAGMLYPDFHTSNAFAMVDHEVAHVYMNPAVRTLPPRATDRRTLDAVATSLMTLPGIDRILAPEEQQVAGIDHMNSGDLVLTAKPGYWFAYPWWSSSREAPDYASHVDIHNKPGYDPCELFLGWPPLSVSQDTARIKGSHGRVSTAAWASSLALPTQPASLLELATLIRQRLDDSP